jgi:uncharacterized protein YcfL
VNFLQQAVITFWLVNCSSSNKLFKHMQPMLKERKISSEKKQLVTTTIRQDAKKTSSAKTGKLLVNYNGIVTVINRQEDEDAAVRADVWN